MQQSAGVFSLRSVIKCRSVVLHRRLHVGVFINNDFEIPDLLFESDCKTLDVMINLILINYSNIQNSF